MYSSAIVHDGRHGTYPPYPAASAAVLMDGAKRMEAAEDGPHEQKLLRQPPRRRRLTRVEALQWSPPNKVDLNLFFLANRAVNDGPAGSTSTSSEEPHAAASPTTEEERTQEEEEEKHVGDDDHHVEEEPEEPEEAEVNEAEPEEAEEATCEAHPEEEAVEQEVPPPAPATLVKEEPAPAVEAPPPQKESLGAPTSTATSRSELRRRHRRQFANRVSYVWTSTNTTTTVLIPTTDSAARILLMGMLPTEVAEAEAARPALTAPPLPPPSQAQPLLLCAGPSSANPPVEPSYNIATRRDEQSSRPHKPRPQTHKKKGASSTASPVLPPIANFGTGAPSFMDPRQYAALHYRYAPISERERYEDLPVSSSRSRDDSRLTKYLEANKVV